MEEGAINAALSSNSAALDAVNDELKRVRARTIALEAAMSAAAAAAAAGGEKNEARERLKKKLEVQFKLQTEKTRITAEREGSTVATYLLSQLVTKTKLSRGSEAVARSGGRRPADG